MLMIKICWPLLLATVALRISASQPASSQSASQSAVRVQDTPLQSNFCQDYWALDATSSPSCEEVRSHVVANHSRPLPTLEMGSPTKPALIFLHGWPDTAAMWANQFAHFCFGPNARFYCIGTTMDDFHPDFPVISADPDRWSRLGFQFEVDRIASVMKELELTNATIVTHDSGCQVRWILAYKFPQLVSRIVALPFCIVADASASWAA